MTEREAYARFNREQRMKRQWARKLRDIELTIEGLRLDMEFAFAEGDARMADTFNGNPRYRKTVDAFLNLRGYRKNMAGWRAACGSDIGLYKKTNRLKWPRLWRILLESRKRRQDDRLPQKRTASVS